MKKPPASDTGGYPLPTKIAMRPPLGTWIRMSSQFLHLPLVWVIIFFSQFSETGCRDFSKCDLAETCAVTLTINNLLKYFHLFLYHDGGMAYA